MMPVEVWPADEQLLDSIGELRVAAWSPVVGAAQARERFYRDDYDKQSMHFCVHHSADRRLLAAGRLTVCQDPAELPERDSFGSYAPQMCTPLGIAGRLVVHPAGQGAGLAEQIIVGRLEHAAGLGLVEVWSETRRHKARGFLRHGYERVGSSGDASVEGDWEIFRARLRRAHPHP
ncbi:MAG: hypothetical protein OES57_02670 [Acidimicrobiia bacterium]|nr:hypothetical protein [Acidimicrobiia bacterium]